MPFIKCPYCKQGDDYLSCEEGVDDILCEFCGFDYMIVSRIDCFDKLEHSVVVKSEEFLRYIYFANDKPSIERMQIEYDNICGSYQYDKKLTADEVKRIIVHFSAIEEGE